MTNIRTDTDQNRTAEHGTKLLKSAWNAPHIPLLPQKVFMVNSINKTLMTQLHMRQFAWIFVGLVYRNVVSNCSSLLSYRIHPGCDICKTISATNFMRQKCSWSHRLTFVAWNLWWKSVASYKENSGIFHAMDFRRRHHEHLLSYDIHRTTTTMNTRQNANLSQVFLCKMHLNILCFLL